MIPSRFVHEALSTRIIFGAGAVADVRPEFERLAAARALLVNTSSAKEVADEVAMRLGGRVAGRIGEVRQHVPAEDAAHASEEARRCDADSIVVVGGGSAIGLAKAVSLETGVPILAVPTTYSGSEATPIYGITAHGAKRTGREARVLPRAVVYDPEVTTSLPPAVTAASGMNALAHCVEALYGRGASPVIRLLAEEGGRSLVQGLPPAVSEPDDLQARTAVLYGAWLAGTALAGAEMGLHHTLAHVLGGRYGLDHGGANAALLPHVVALNAAAVPAAIAAFARLLGVDDAAAGLFRFAGELGAPTRLEGLGFSPDWIEEAARLTVESLRWNPRPVAEADIVSILERACAGLPPHDGGARGDRVS